MKNREMSGMCEQKNRMNKHPRKEKDKQEEYKESMNEAIKIL